MKLFEFKKTENKMFFVLLCFIFTGLVYQYRLGVSGNDFWWHVKTGEWIVANSSIPKLGIFSWYAMENGIEWISHEWLSEIFFYVMYRGFGDIGIFFLSFCSACIMVILIVHRNKNGILYNSSMAIIYLFPVVLLFPIVFYGRPQLISSFLFFITLSFLYQFREDEDSKTIYLVPVISILWSNFHGGSSNLPYILCILFFLTGLFNFSHGKISADKLTLKQIKTYLIVGIVSIAAIIINPHGAKMIIYPYINIGDSFMQVVISEWHAPDIKNFAEFLYFVYPIVIVGIILIIADKKISLIDFTMFLFFSYMAFRSIRFSILFFIASTFFTFNYFLPREIRPMKVKYDRYIFAIIVFLLLVINIISIKAMFGLHSKDNLISIALDNRFITIVQKESPKRLYNDYDFGETLIYNNIDTFVDARADIFATNNLHDAISLLFLEQSDTNESKGIFDPEEIIEMYDFDAFLVDSSRCLAVYLKSHPEKYKLIYEDANAVYFDVLNSTK